LTDVVPQLPETTVDGITLVVAPFLRSPHYLLVSSTLTSFLPFYLPLLPISAPSQHLRLALHQLLPPLLEKLNDPKERTHTAASSCVILLGRKCFEAEPPGPSPPVGLGVSTKGKEKEGLVGYWERSVKEAMTGKGWRGKVEVMKMLLSMRAEATIKLPLKPWLAPLVELLEDGDGNVRDQAREVSSFVRPYDFMLKPCRLW
jgi:CLIP-associating protein 1/2